MASESGSLSHESGTRPRRANDSDPGFTVTPSRDLHDSPDDHASDSKPRPGCHHHRPESPEPQCRKPREEPELAASDFCPARTA